ncbi:MAG: tetratricopeptide repeat protein [Deltaproteobacteria bacterium]|nr:tetratricopeptide repeat protein [Deltaproteobacteria bacterium]
MSLIHQALKKLELASSHGSSGYGPEGVLKSSGKRRQAFLQLVFIAAGLILLAGLLSHAYRGRGARQTPLPVKAAEVKAALPASSPGAQEAFGAPIEADEHNRRGIQHYSMGRLTEAAGEFKAAVAEAGKEARRHVYYNNLGQTYAAMGDVKGADENLKEAALLKPDYAEALNNLGALRLKGGEYLKAAGLFEKAVEVNPAYPEAHMNLAAAFEHSGRYEEAIAHYEKYLEITQAKAEDGIIRKRVKGLKSYVISKDD